MQADTAVDGTGIIAGIRNSGANAAKLAVGRNNVLAGIRNSGNDPAKFAISLLQAQQAAFSPECAALSGYEHCAQCAEPALANLVTELVKVSKPLSPRVPRPVPHIRLCCIARNPALPEANDVTAQVKTEVWSDQKSISNTATGVCTKQAPSDRTGGASKCCASPSATSGQFTPSGYQQCTASTFSAKAGTPVASDIKYAAASGFYYDGAETPSTMINDCCDTSSTCTQNQVVAAAAMDTLLTEMATSRSESLAKETEKTAEGIKESLERAKAIAVKAAIKTICTTADEAADVPAWPTTIAELTTKCTSGQAVDTIISIDSLHTKVIGDIASDIKTIAIILKVRLWLEESTDKTTLFQDHAHGAAPTVETMMALLESAHSEAGNAGAVSALEKATQLVQGSTAGHSGTHVLALLDTLIADFTASKDKKVTYAASLITEKGTHLASFKDQIVAKNQMFATALTQEAAHLARQAVLQSEISGAAVTTNAKKALWIVAFNDREANTQQCIDFMDFFDGETVINTEELLVLKKAIDIIKHIDCLGTDIPTAAPTTFPTLAPTTITTTATAAATAATTDAPTTFPTAAPTTPTNCAAGNYTASSRSCTQTRPATVSQRTQAA